MNGMEVGCDHERNGDRLQPRTEWRSAATTNGMEVGCDNEKTLARAEGQLRIQRLDIIVCSIAVS